jgi:hypothetical protein
LGIFDWLKRRDPEPLPPSDPPLLTREATGYIGHGRRWAMFGDGYRDLIGPLVNEAVADAHVPDRLPAGASAHRVLHGQDEVRVCCVVADGAVQSANPYIAGGAQWRASVREVHHWPVPVEGQLVVTAYGARIGLFDTHFCTSRTTYERHRTRDFIVNGWAYRLEQSDVDPAKFADDFCAYLPIPEESGGCVDEVQFSSRVESVRKTSFFGQPLVVYRLTLARPDTPLTLDVFATQKASAREFAAGDRVAGQVWLFGHTV